VLAVAPLIDPLPLYHKYVYVPLPPPAVPVNVPGEVPLQIVVVPPEIEAVVFGLEYVKVAEVPPEAQQHDPPAYTLMVTFEPVPVKDVGVTV
jgi:hypothetical protein